MGMLHSLRQLTVWFELCVDLCDIDNVMRVVVSWSALEGGKIYMRVYEVKMSGGKALLDE